MQTRSQQLSQPQDQPPVEARYLWFFEDRLICFDDGEVLFSRAPEGFERFRLPVAEYLGFAVYLCSLSRLPGEVSKNALRGLRPLLAESDEQRFKLLSRASQLQNWYRSHRVCCRCGSATELSSEQLTAHCPACEYRQYPRLSPCIIVLVRRGRHCLLAHAAHFSPRRYSTLAGFIEAGESAEEAVAREVREEVGIEISNIRYWQSQSWPFPHALMLGFFADYQSGALQVDGKEIIHADWWLPGQFPELPPPFAISRQLIDEFVRQSQSV